MRSLKRLREVLISFRVSALRVKKVKSWEERLKRIEMMIRKSNEGIDERFNDDINHNNEVII